MTDATMIVGIIVATPAAVIAANAYFKTCRKLQARREAARIAAIAARKADRAMIAKANKAFNSALVADQADRDARPSTGDINRAFETARIQDLFAS